MFSASVHEPKANGFPDLVRRSPTLTYTNIDEDKRYLPSTNEHRGRDLQNRFKDGRRRNHYSILMRTTANMYLLSRMFLMMIQS